MSAMLSPFLREGTALMWRMTPVQARGLQNGFAEIVRDVAEFHAFLNIVTPLDERVPDARAAGDDIHDFLEPDGILDRLRIAGSISRRPLATTSGLPTIHPKPSCLATTRLSTFGFDTINCIPETAGARDFPPNELALRFAMWLVFVSSFIAPCVAQEAEQHEDTT